MAIFGKNRAQQGPGHGATIVATGSQLVGNITLSDRLHIDGRVEGDVDSESGVVIGCEGHLKGTIKAREVVVSGRVEGSIAAERLEIIAGGNVEGDVHTVNLIIEPGGRFNGSSEILAEAERLTEVSGDASAPSSAKDQTGSEPAPAKPARQPRADAKTAAAGS